jgi:glutaminase
LFDALADIGSETVSSKAVTEAFHGAGLRLDDPRLVETVSHLQPQRTEPEQRHFDYRDFVELVKPSLLVLERAVKRELVIPDFATFGSEMRRIYETTRRNRDGKVADYIPQLGRVDPEQYGVALCTIDGQRMTLGDADVPFCLQSSCKPINYCMALEEHGEEVVHRHIGCEPSGQSFNELALNPRGLPHNPMINAGAIMSCSLIQPGTTMADRFDHVLAQWQELTGGVRPGFSNPTYLSERRTADRNFALGYFMREHEAFPTGTDLVETLEFYFQCCSLEITADRMAVVAATLANGGVCPTTGRRVFRPETVQKCLSLMYSCGMYDFSGEWAFRIGLPAKSGVSGIIMVVVPNVMGYCCWSPRLDSHGNSVRGIEFSRQLVSTFNFHNYDNLTGELSGKLDPRDEPGHRRRDLLVDLCWAASEGDLGGIRRLVVQGAGLDGADYDGRTPLHLAASEGREEVVAYMLSEGVNRSPIDRWGNVPLDDARRGEHDAVVALLEGA